MSDEKAIEKTSIELENELIACYSRDPDDAREWEYDIKPYLFSTTINKRIAKIIQDNITKKRPNTIGGLISRYSELYPENPDESRKHFKELAKINIMPDHIPSILERLKEFARRRKLEEIGHELIRLSKEEPESEQIESYAKKALEELYLFGSEDSMRSLYEIGKETLSSPPKIGENTGFDTLDKHTGGFRGGELIVIGAAAGTGKTTLALNFLDNLTSKHLIEKQDTGGLFFSLEMSEDEIFHRILAKKNKISLRDLRINNLNDEDVFMIRDSLEGIIKDQNIYIDCANNTIDDIVRKAKIRMLKQPYRFLAVDYIQIIKPGAEDYRMQRYMQLGSWSSKLKALAKELNIPVLVLSQLNKTEDREKTPTLNSLRESGNIGNDADYVIITTAEKDQKTILNNYLVKARHAEGGLVFRTVLKGAHAWIHEIEDSDLSNFTEYKKNNSLDLKEKTKKRQTPDPQSLEDLLKDDDINNIDW